MNLKCTKCMCRFDYTELAASGTDTSKILCCPCYKCIIKGM